MFLCALVGPCSPHLPRPASSMCPSCVSACLVVVFFFLVGFPAAPVRPASAPCSSPCYPCPAALRPLFRLSPLSFPFSLSTLPVRLPSLSVPRRHSCVPPACSTPAPPPRPYPFPWVLPRSPPLTPSWLPGALWGGGGGVSVVWTVALPEVWHGRWLPTHHEPPHVPNEHRENARETLVEFPSLHLHCGAQPHR